MSFEYIFSQIVILFIVLLIGYIANKVDFMDKAGNQKLSVLVMSVALPCKTLSTLNEAECTKADIISMTVVTCFVFLFLALVAKVVPKLLRTKEEETPVLEFMTVFSNNSFMGYPVIESVMGVGALIYASVYSIFTCILFFSYGEYLFQKCKTGSRHIEWKKMISTSSVGGILTLLLAFREFRFPELPYRVLSMIGGLTTPLSMLIIGSSLAAIPVKKVFKGWRVYVFSIIRLVVAPLLTYVVFRRFVTNPMILGVLVLTVAMPAASMAVMFAEKYENNVSYATQHVFISTLLSVLTIPLISCVLF